MTGASERPAARARGGFARRALLAYLVVAWLLARHLESAGAVPVLVSAGLLAGFPLAAFGARLLGRRGPAWLRRRWAVAGSATAVAMTLPIACLVLHGPASVRAETGETPVEIVPARLLSDGIDGRAQDGLSLRIKGLTLAAEDGSASPVELRLDTELREDEGRRELVIRVTLSETEGGRPRWHASYVIDAEDAAAINAAVRRALAEAMGRTCQGAPPGQLV